MKKLLFLIHTLGRGGAEKALVNLVNNLDAEKFDITVETMFDDGINAKSLKPHIHYISKKAPCPKGISILLKLFPSFFLYKYFIGKNNYDLLVAYMHGAPVKVICGNKKAKRIAWLHNGNPESSTMFENWMIKKNAVRAYSSCDAVVGVCESVTNAFSDYTEKKDGMYTVYNTLDIDYIRCQAEKPIDIAIDKERINIVSTGRLGKEKGYERLIDVCNNLKKRSYSFRLYIIGDGAEKKYLQSKIDDLSLNNEVFLLGYKENPYAYINKCDIFICSSFTEGLSTATIEALILGKAIISTDVSGAFEILGNSEYGVIVENSKSGIEKGLTRFLDNESLITDYCEKAKQRSDFFSISNTISKAENLFDRDF